MKFRVLIIVGLVFALAIPVALAYRSPGKPTNYVNDYAGMLSAGEKGALNNQLAGNEADSSNEIAVVTIPTLMEGTTEGSLIEDIVPYGTALFNEWGIGKKDKDNGVLLLVAKDQKKIRIEVGYGLSGALTDAISSRIIREKIIPAFNAGNYGQGISDAVAEIINVTAGEFSN